MILLNYLFSNSGGTIIYITFSNADYLKIKWQFLYFYTAPLPKKIPMRKMVHIKNHSIKKSRKS